MSYARAAATVFAAFLLSNVFAIAIHGFMLAADYAPYRGTLLRDFQGGPGWQSLLLPVAHLCFISGLVWIYGRLSLEGSHAARGLKLGSARVADWTGSALADLVRRAAVARQSHRQTARARAAVVAGDWSDDRPRVATARTARRSARRHRSDGRARWDRLVR